MNFFRENKSARKGILITVVTLFFLGALVNNNGQSRVSHAVGKRKLDIGLIQAQFEATIDENPSVDHKQLQAYLVQQETEKLSFYNHLENIGLTPSIKAVKSALAAELPDDLSISDLAKQHHQTRDELILAVSDRVAFNQLLTAINNSAIITNENKALHKQVIGQQREYASLAISDIPLTASQADLEAIYEQQKHMLMSPKTYNYQYVEVSPKTLGLPEPSSQEVNRFLAEHISEYTDQKVNYTLTSSSTKKPPQEHNVLLSNTGKLKATLKTLSVGESTTVYEKEKPLQLTLNHSEATNSLSPDKRTQLVQDTHQAIHQNALTQSLKQIEEYAYTHPNSLIDLANTHKLSIKTASTHQPSMAILSALNDEDVRQHHYISTPIKLEDGSHILLQLISVSEPTPLAYAEVKDKVASIYKDQVQCPQAINKLRASDNISRTSKELELEIEPLTHNLYDTAISPVLSAVIPKRSAPNPDTVLYGPSGQRWIQLKRISFDIDTQYPPDAIEGLDAEATISQLKDNT